MLGIWDMITFVRGDLAPTPSPIAECWTHSAVECCKERKMEVLTDAKIAEFVGNYPLLTKPIEILRRRVEGRNIPLHIRIIVKRMDIFTPYFVGNPTSGR